jgi:MFS transporter, MHS family, proline/betaine transporter
VADGARSPWHAAVAAGLGTVIEYYDFQLYAVLALTLSPLFFANHDATTALLWTLGIFAGAFLMRPLGGIFFGWLGDRYGRTAALSVTIIGIGFASAFIGLLPTYVTVGVAAPVLLLLLRLAQGFFAGGEIAGSATYIAECSPSNRRGFFGAFNGAASTLGLTLASAVAALTVTLAGTERMHQWAWRIPFLVSVPLILLCFWARSKLEESPRFEAMVLSKKILKSPLRELLTHNLKGLTQLICLAFAQSAAGYVCLVYLNIHMTKTLGYQAAGVGWLISIVTFVAAFLMPLCGALSDRIGRKLTMAIGLIGYMILTPATMFVASLGSFVAASAAVAVGALPFVMVQASGYSLYAELFPTRVRYLGVSMGFNIAQILGGGTAPYIAAWLTSATGSSMAPSYYVATAAFLGLITLTTVSETANKPLSE